MSQTLESQPHDYEYLPNDDGNRESIQFLSLPTGPASSIILEHEPIPMLVRDKAHSHIIAISIPPRPNPSRNGHYPRATTPPSCSSVDQAYSTSYLNPQRPIFSSTNLSQSSSKTKTQKPHPPHHQRSKSMTITTHSHHHGTPPPDANTTTIPTFPYNSRRLKQRNLVNQNTSTLPSSDFCMHACGISLNIYDHQNPTLMADQLFCSFIHSRSRRPKAKAKAQIPTCFPSTGVFAFP